MDIGQVAEILGVDRPSHPIDTPLQLVDRIEKGLPLTSLDRVVAAVAPDDAGFKYRVVPKASLARRRHKARLSADESERVARIARVWAFAREVWGGDQHARDFLSRPHLMLDDRLPIDVVIRSEAGAQVVEGILGSLLYGSAA
jgi:putative toxin-antitoxin system antitoxin component (TIGR02293 family)